MQILGGMFYMKHRLVFLLLAVILAFTMPLSLHRDVHAEDEVPLDLNEAVKLPVC